MATINISDLRPTGYDLLSDSESYMSEVGDSEFDAIYGGATPTVVVATLASVAKATIKRSSAKCAEKVAIASGAVFGWIVGD